MNIPEQHTLDPENWDQYRLMAHQMVDDMLDFLKDQRSQPVWQKPPAETGELLKQSLPGTGDSLPNIYADFKKHILPYRKGNIHPRYFSWVEGTGTFTGALADFLASVMNSNLGIGDHSAMQVESQVLDWCREMMGYPSTSSGVLTSGGSLANITALTVARNSFRNANIRKEGLKNVSGQLILYCSTETHNSIFKAAETLGIGADFIRKIPVNDRYEIDIVALEKQILDDRGQGLLPFCIVGNAGTVNTGAIDPLSLLSAISKKENCWFHIDGAIGALLHILPEYQKQLQALTEADSIAFDLHKWLYVNYEAGCALIRDRSLHRGAFIQPANYLSSHARGLAAGPETFSNYGLELSRGFRSLKIWMSLREHGLEKYQSLIRQNISQAKFFGERVKQSSKLELLAAVNINIVCFRYNPGGLSDDRLNEINKEILMRVQEEGSAAPSYTMLENRYAIRMSITNHRTNNDDLEIVLDRVIRIGKDIA
jgi:aromatic-L-amino-acid/L-tryptophan decarboxylase